MPFIYYGEEIGMNGSKPDEDIRRPMQWVSDSVGVGFTTGTPWRMPALDYKEKSVATEKTDPDSLLNHYRALIHLRNEYPALRTGAWQVINAGSARVYAFLRYQEGEYFLVLMNVHPKDLTLEDYALSLETGPFSGAVSASSLLGLENPTAPVINSHGGFSDYRPFESIPSQSFAIIRLTP